MPMAVPGADFTERGRQATLRHDRRRRTTRDASGLVAVLLIAAGLFSCSSAAAFESSDRSAYAAAVSYCRTKPNQLVLSEDRSIFCFDGKVSPERDASSLEALDSGGLFVVRSVGGGSTTATRIAMLLEKKQATVVVYDYCISACAKFSSSLAPEHTSCETRLLHGITERAGCFAVTRR
jgi:hypothetical protein